MKRNTFIFFLLSFILIVNSMCVFADDEINDNYSDDQLSDLEEVDITSPAQVVVDITQLINNQREEVDPVDNPVQVVENLEPQLIDVNVSQLRISPSDTNGLKAVMLTILGDYEPTITDYTYQNNNYQYLSHSISIERDWSWICTCGIFALVLYFTFRTIGGICARF